MTYDDLIRTVSDLYAKSAAGDWETVEAMLTDDFFILEADSLPMAGIYRGKSALRDLFGQVMSMMDVAAIERVEITAGKDHAIAILSLRFADPSLEPARLLELFRFRDGLICEIRPYYFDPAPVMAACAAKAAATA